MENNKLQVVPNLTWSYSGSTTITYSVIGITGVTVSSWITIDTSTGLLSISAPNVSADTMYSFYINSYITGVTNPTQKLISLTVINWGVQNWQSCISTSGSTCQTCYTDYTLNSGQWAKIVRAKL